MRSSAYFDASRLGLALLVMLSAALVAARPALATDHILTIGGGYAPEGNQASLEANVQFFQRVITEKHPGRSTHRIQFADGFDSTADLQIALPPDNTRSAALTALDEIFAPPGPPGSSTRTRVGYRNHRVSPISGSNRIGDVKNAMEVMRSQIRAGDRLIVYVTAHGGSAKKSEPYDTSISCWGNRDLRMREFAQWLDTLPSSVPVVLVMAQCYCGGFGQTIFTGGQPDDGLSKAVRTGFFAQRHDLPAAGCRPDIENDQEYSSYFWGAMLGKSRTGKPIDGVDLNRDGHVSWVEAHAYAVIASETVDIPLRGSDVLLRSVSRIPDYELDYGVPEEGSSSDESLDTQTLANTDAADLRSMSGSLEEVMQKSPLIEQAILGRLAKDLEMQTTSSVTEVFRAYTDAEQTYRNARRGGFGFSRRSRGGFIRRREVRDAIIEKWPELEDMQGWETSSLLGSPEKQSKFYEELKELPAFKSYLASKEQREKSRNEAFAAEMRYVRLRRMVHTLESAVLAQNIEKVATPEEIQRYKELVALESSFFE